MTTASEGIVRSIGLAAVNLQGFIDAIERGIVYGWAWNPQRPEETIEVEILLGGTQLAVVAADRFREDLVGLEIGDGRHAFEYALADDLVGQVDGSEIEVRFAGSEIPLPRMQVRPQLRTRPDGTPRPEAETILALQQRIAMQEQVINDMSNLLRGMVDRFKNLPVPSGNGNGSGPVLDGELSEALERQETSLKSIETYVATFGQSLREIAEAGKGQRSATPEGTSSFRGMDALFLGLLAAVVIGFVLVFGDIF